ncbi:MAG: bifunctional riboflavin kinase/FAD synthetase [Bacteroidales bacterium]|nr:bifunctional riboflavin kinase/FAD synthetase [Bacteroidales bacterium]
MKTHHSFDTINNIKNPAITVGMVDGVHLGHQAILKELARQAQNIGGESIVITFWPHPRSVVSDNPVLLLNTLDEKLVIIQEAGIDHVVVLPFTREFSVLSPKDFIKTLLFEKLHFKVFIVGYDHHFGKNRHGDFELVSKLGKELNFKAVKVSALQLNNINVSSTKIREALAEGNIKTANRFLSYHYSLTGTVIKGEKLGTKLGFPTANLKFPQEKLIPAKGVYSAQVICRNGDIHYSMVNIGNKPTVNSDTEKLFIEVHIFNFDRRIYGENITISLLEKIRNEKKFNDITALRNQLEKDKLTILKTLNK